jgi:hypothetical protein
MKKRIKSEPKLKKYELSTQQNNKQGKKKLEINLKVII